jgi:ectoine hydroxylase-related dioxygenase (phytanoyl-CoA dioxygenase family)
MLNRFLNQFCNTKSLLKYRLVPHSFLRNPEITKSLHKNGYYVADFLREEELQLLLELYRKHDSGDIYEIHGDRSGAYLGLISSNLHYTIKQILNSTFEKWFKNYKNIINAFSIKTPGGSGKVPIHQDAAAVDEEKYSAITIWIALQDVNSQNGALHIIPRSHHIFIPYRGATIERPTKNIESLLSPYFVPIYLKAGQALFFDSRMFHYSPPNLTGQSRVAVNCRICSAESEIVAYYKEEAGINSKIEMWRCPDNYLFTISNHDSSVRPRNCEWVDYKYADTKLLTEKEFEQIRKDLKINPATLAEN